MTKRAVRLALLVLFAAGTVAAGYHVVSLQSQMAAGRSAAATFEDAAATAALEIVELRGSQQAYVAAGQNEEFWIERVDSLTESLRSRLERLVSRSTAPGSADALHAARQAVEGFEQMDRRAREHARSGQRLLASDLIFTDGFEMMQSAAHHLETARAAERAGREAGEVALRYQQAYVLGGAAATALLLMLLLVPIGTSAHAAAAAEQPGIAPASAIPEPEAADADPLGAALDARASEWTATPAPRPGTDLGEAAWLCTELGRLVDSAELPGLLERAARLFEAPGLIVWMGQAGGVEIRPALAYGYPDGVLGRMGPIHREADNATAAAFRTGELQVVKAGSDSNGAIVAPLVTAAGCVGAMAAEVRRGREDDDSLRALARIIAAQLATLLPPEPADGAASRTARS